MKKIILIILLIILIVSAIGGLIYIRKINIENKIQLQEKEEVTVRNLVESFGSRLQEVSLAAPKEIAAKNIQESYRGLVSPQLIAEWGNDPSKAPGRLVSSPWPDRIEISSVQKVADNKYQIEGEIIEITSVEVVQGGYAAKRKITLIVEKIQTRWIITSVSLGPYE